MMAARPLVTGRARLLVVDDESTLLSVYARMLGRHHDVEVASSGALALATLVATPAFDVVLCDLNLPDMRGPELYRSACGRWPELADRFLFMTGDRPSGVPGFGDVASTVPVLEKPFNSATVLAAIREVLDRVSPRPEG